VRDKNLMKTIEISGIKAKPIEVFERLFNGRSYPFLLESGMRNPDYGRYSIMGSDPFLRFKSKGKHIEIIEDGKSRCIEGNPFNVLKDLLRRYSDSRFYASPEGRLNFDSRLPFVGGAVGYFAYDLGWHIEKLPNFAVDDINLPDCCICFYHNCLIFDNIKNNVFVSGEDTSELVSSLKSIRKSRNVNVLSQNMHKIKYECGAFTSNFTHYEYINAIKKAKQYISCGDIYQVNLSQRFECQIETQPFELYKKLHDINPAPFSAFLDYGDFAIVSSSPERFLSIKNGVVQTRPIKGTRPRGKNAAEDRKLGQELLESEKDRAELVMIVDLERNDLGRACEYGTVRVKKLAEIEKYPTVFHTVATVEGILYKGRDAIDMLKAVFPGGSITGAPKIRAMEIIEELEPTKRSVYTGAIGYLGFNGNADLNIVIRTFIVKGNKAYFQVGGGIVADSDPEAEYQETLDKAKALIDTIIN
jgi:para-aminobenzoate synthetase component I